MAACFFAGDCGSASVVNESTTNFSSLVSQTSTFIKSNSQKTASDVMNIQTAQLYVVEMGEKCDINLSQSITLSQQTSGELNADSMTDLRSLISTGLQNIAAQEAESTAEMGSGALTQSTDSTNITNVNTSIQDIVNTTVSDSNYAEVLSSTLNQQDSVIKIGKCNGKLTIGQDIVADVIAKNLMDLVLTNLQTNTVTADVFNNVGQSGRSASEGLAGLVDSILGGIADVLGTTIDALMAPLIACIIVCCLCCAGLIFVMMSPGGQNAASAGANIAKARYA